MLNANKSYELNILINNRSVTEFSHEGNTFIEGRKGSEFELEFKNKSSRQVLIVPSVDGKSIFDGKPATPESQGYVIRGWGSIRIPGWTLDSDAVAKFTFEDKDKSYSAAITPEGEPVVTGVIGVMVFAEKQKPASVTTVIHHHINPWPTIRPRGPYDPYWDSGTWYGSASPTGAMSKGVMRGMAMNNATTLSASSSVSDASQEVSTPDSFDMGAGFGQKQDFKTTSVAFERAEVLATMTVYYESRRSLEKRGIQVVKTEVRPSNDLPQAFQGTGCRPPEGWQG
jgi:hypothetical protein